MNQLKVLDILYDELGFNGPSLFSAMTDPSFCPSQKDWLEKGEWLLAAKQAGAEKVFFVKNNPVVVFSKCDTDNHEDKVKAFNKAWCLARPRLLFLSSPGKITVFDLAKPPIEKDKQKEWEDNAIEIIETVGTVAKKLQKFHRDNIESGHVFGDKCFGNLNNRADKALIRDLKIVRRKLIEAGLDGEKTRFAHALIGRSIFIRYLEDRGVLTKEYFENVAKQKSEWMDILRNPTLREGFDFSEKKSFYSCVLMDKDFVYALFRELSNDFNGDMFHEVEKEEQIVSQDHLELIQRLLYGKLDRQLKLFFYSYNFEIIPLDLISSIYEAFYHSSPSEAKNKSKAQEDGAYYTPPVLAEFLLSRVLTPETINQKPRILDPACGSGIFLVEAFRRIVRYEWHRKKSRLTFEELKNILKQQIAGIEVNEESAKVTAFSLYFSMLHYLEPRAINQQINIGNTLPYLLATTEDSENHFHCILPANVFDVNYIESNPIWKETFGHGCADIVIGNPPWGPPKKQANNETKKRQKVMVDWCKTNNKSVANKEPSQAFLWRALDFLKEDGKGGLLVSLGVFFNHHLKKDDPKKQSFRKQWLKNVKLETVFNFTHVREFFFTGAAWPFVAVSFVKTNSPNTQVTYWSAKQSRIINNAQAVYFSPNDIKIIRNEPLEDCRVWKLYDYAGYKDAEFINFLDNFSYYTPLNEHAEICVGFKKASQKLDADWLANYDKIKKGVFSRYSEFCDDDFEPVPAKVEHRGRNKDIYEGNRIVMKEAVQKADNGHGRIVARYETKNYAYTHSFHVIKLKSDDKWKYQTLIGILWSSFARYYLFLTSSNWWGGNDKILVNEKSRLPVVFDKSNPATKKIIRIVNKLCNYHPQQYNLDNLDGVSEEILRTTRNEWEKELDEAVFDLYGLNEEQKNLVRDLCEVTLPFLYKPFASKGTDPAVTKNKFSWIKRYVDIFCRRWNAYLKDDEQMRAEIHLGAQENMVAVEFFPADKNDPWMLAPRDDKWNYLLEQIGKALPTHMGTSKIILDGLVHIVSNNGIIIIKRNEKRFWTRSLAREDADAMLCKCMLYTMPKEEGNNC